MFDGSDLFTGLLSISLGFTLGALLGKDVRYTIKKLKTKGDNSAIGVTQAQERKRNERNKKTHKRRRWLSRTK